MLHVILKIYFIADHRGPIMYSSLDQQSVDYDAASIMNILLRSFFLLFLCVCCLSVAVAQQLAGTKPPSDSLAPPKPGATAAEKKPEKESVHILPPVTWGHDSEYRLQLGGDTRLRMESRRNFDLDSTVDDDDNLAFLRTRVNAELVRKDMWRVFIELLDGREINSNIHREQENYWDLHQAYFDYGMLDKHGYRMRLGRQELSFGEGRIVNASSWGNLIRSFDGARFTWKDEQSVYDAFLLQQVIHDTVRNGEIISDRGRRKSQEWFYGLYSTHKFFDPHELDLYAVGLTDRDEERTFPSEVTGEDGRFGSSDRYTIGSRMRGPIWEGEGVGRLEYGLEGAFQFGHKATDRIRAHMLHADVVYEWEHRWKPKLMLEGNLASGDRNPEDGIAETYNPLFHSSHTPYGVIDFARLQNLREIALTGSVEPTDRLKVQLEYHNFWLDSKTDSWMNSSGDKFGHDKTGRSGHHLGHEIDLIVGYKLSKRVTLEAGAAHFIGGDYADRSGLSGSGNLFYLQTVVKF